MILQIFRFGIQVGVHVLYICPCCGLPEYYKEKDGVKA